MIIYTRLHIVFYTLLALELFFHMLQVTFGLSPCKSDHSAVTKQQWREQQPMTVESNIYIYIYTIKQKRLDVTKISLTMSHFTIHAK